MTKPSPHCATCIIRDLSLLKNCSAGVLDEISKKKTSQSFKMGASLVKKDSMGGGIFCIRSGVVKEEVQHNKNGTLILRLEGKGTIVGYRTAGAMARQPLAITAVEEVQACHLSAEGFRSILSDSPELRNEINKALLSEICSIEQKALSLATNTVRERIAEALLHIARVYQYKERGRSVHTHLDRQDIADMAGTTREQVSKVLAEFRRSGLIKFRAKHLKYFDLAGLRKVAMLSNDNLV